MSASTFNDARRNLSAAAHHPDTALACAIFVFGAAAGMVYQATWGGLPQFWQSTTFMQSVAWACGHGFRNPMVADIPGLEDFLGSKTDCFDCAAIPPDVRLLPRDTSGMTFEEIDAYHPQDLFPGFLAWQRYHRNLVWAVAFCWAAFGVCWSALTPLCGLLYGTTCLAVYGLFRLGLHRAWATACALLIAVSPLHLQMLPHIRDYSKAPFLLPALFLMGCLVRWEWPRRAVFALAAGCGALLGIGLGFRTDAAIAVPAFAMVALCFLPGGLRCTLRLRLAALGLFLTVFAAVGAPVIIELMRESGHFCHIALLGFLTYCDERLGVGSPLYHLGGPFSDYYLSNAVQVYIHRLGEPMPPTTIWNAPYNEAARHFLKDYVSLVPGDIVVRAYASVLRVLDEMRIDPANPWPRNITNRFLQSLYEVRAACLDHLPGGGRYHAAAALLIIASRNLRWGFAALFLLIYFAGYPAFKFNLQHAFHLEFIQLWAAAFLAQSTLYALLAARSARFPTVSLLRASAARAAVFALISITGLGLLLLGARAIQHARLGQHIARIVDTPLKTLTPSIGPGSGGGVWITLPGLGPTDSCPDLPACAAYLAIDVRGPAAAVPVTLVYEADNREHYDYTRTIEVSAPASPDAITRLYVPVYFHQDARFKGIRIDEGADRLAGIHQVPREAAPPLWLTLILPPDWRERPLHQAFTR